VCLAKQAGERPTAERVRQELRRIRGEYEARLAGTAMTGEAAMTDVDAAPEFTDVDGGPPEHDSESGSEMFLGRRNR
jgi:hypothetical protein